MLNVVGYIMDYIIKLWRGDELLVVTYWVFGFGVNLLFNICSKVLDRQDPSEINGWATIILILVAVLYAPYILVCVWRSANKYKGNPIWSSLAKISVVVSVCGVGATILGILVNIL